MEPEADQFPVVGVSGDRQGVGQQTGDRVEIIARNASLRIARRIKVGQVAGFKRQLRNHIGGDIGTDDPNRITRRQIVDVRPQRAAQGEKETGAEQQRCGLTRSVNPEVHGGWQSVSEPGAKVQRGSDAAPAACPRLILNPNLNLNLNLRASNKMSFPRCDGI